MGEHPLLALQRTAGNAAVVQALDGDGAGLLPAQTLKQVQQRHGALKKVAEAKATSAWPKSYGPKKESARAEYGGVIYEKPGGGHGATERTSAQGDTVDVGQREPNAGCPEGTLPVGYWHTHPRDTDPLTGAPRPRLEGAAAFSTPDLDVAKDYQLDPFVQDKFGLHEVPADTWYDASVYPPWRPPRLPGP